MSDFWTAVAATATVLVPCVVVGRLVLWREMRRTPCLGVRQREFRL